MRLLLPLALLIGGLAIGLASGVHGGSFILAQASGALCYAAGQSAASRYRGVCR